MGTIPYLYITLFQFDVIQDELWRKYKLDICVSYGLSLVASRQTTHCQTFARCSVFELPVKLPMHPGKRSPEPAISRSNYQLHSQPVQFIFFCIFCSDLINTR